MAAVLPANAPRGLLAALPWRTAPRDLVAVRSLLVEAQIDPATPLGGELYALLFARTGECRDFFFLRGGVQVKRRSVLQLAGRSLAADAVATAQIDRLTAGHGRALLSLLATLIELRANLANQPKVKAQAQAQAKAQPKRAAQPALVAAPKAAPVADRLRPANDLIVIDTRLPLAA